MLKKSWVLFVLIFLLINLIPAGAKEPGKLVIILLDQLSLKEISHLGGFELINLFDTSAQALMNVRTDEGIESAYTYEAISAGNRGPKYGAIPGTLGQTLKDNNLKIVLYGNSDYGAEVCRNATMITMDQNGKGSQGEYGRSILVEDSTFPGGWRTDYQAMVGGFLASYSREDLIVLEIGDFARIKQGVKQGEVFEDALEELVGITLRRVDQLITIIDKSLSKSEDCLMLIAPTPDVVSEYSARLSWVLLKRQGTTGVLSTATTRRPGLVTISDIAPTILNFFSLPVPRVMNGRPIYPVIDVHGGLGPLLRLEAQIERTSDWRAWYIKVFILVQIITLALAIMTFFAKRYIKGEWWKITAKLILGVSLIPVVFLLFSPYRIPDFWGYLLILVVILLMTTWLISRFISSAFTQIVLIALITVVLIVIDIFRKSPWMSSSLLGYCPIIGARFYGIGNEFMGILIGGTLVGWTGLLDHISWLKKYQIYLTPVVFMFITFMIGFPSLGANFGGTLTAIAAFSFSYVLMFEKGKRLRVWIGALGIMVLFIAAIIIVDTYNLIGESSHLGQAFQLFRDQGVSALYKIISRKLNMNLKLLRWTIWTRVLLTFILVLALLFKRPKGYLQLMIREYPNFTTGFIGILLGSVVTMLVNDSGVVAAATLLFFAVHPLVYLFLQDAKTGTDDLRVQ